MLIFLFRKYKSKSTFKSLGFGFCPPLATQYSAQVVGPVAQHHGQAALRRGAAGGGGGAATAGHPARARHPEAARKVSEGGPTWPGPRLDETKKNHPSKHENLPSTGFSSWIKTKLQTVGLVLAVELAFDLKSCSFCLARN